MWNRIIDLFHHNVVNLKRDKDDTYNELLVIIKLLRQEIDNIAMSRDMYLNNCSKKTLEIERLKNENVILKQKIK